VRIASLKESRLAVVKDDALVDVSGALGGSGASMIDLILRFDALKGAIADAASKGSAVPLDAKQLVAPLPRPSKIWAAASNYRRGGTDLENAAGRGTTSSMPPESILEMAFLKPPSAVVGPEEQIIIPEGAETIFPELELCVVIGKETRNVSKEQALDAVFGYTIMLDVTARSQVQMQGGLIATRNVRKGYDTFAPCGPWITTRDEIPDPQNLRMQLWVNDALKQSATTAGMINGVADLVSYLSRVSTLHPGDLITTGNPDAPDFQEKLVPGDVLRAEIEQIGSMTLYVAR
jgi:2-keto-4-pentenoate hydratase/2-oxohepta-3-ene-1,7-dioic acid hydratase in catechol pathway